MCFNYEFKMYLLSYLPNFTFESTQFPQQKTNVPI